MSEKDIGFSLRFDFQNENYLQPASPQSLYLRQSFQSISLESRFNARGRTDIEQLQPTLRYSAVSAEYQPTNIIDPLAEDEEDEEGEIEIFQSPNLSWVLNQPHEVSSEEDGLTAREKAASAETRIMFHVADIDASSQMQLCGEMEGASIVGARAKHFLPNQTVVQYDQNATRAKALTDRLLSLGPPHRAIRDLSIADRIPAEVLEMITSHLEQQGFTKTEQLPLFVGDDPEKTISFSEAAKFLRDGFQFQPRVSRKESEASFIRSTSLQMRLRAALQDEQLSHEITKKIADRWGPKHVRTSNRTEEQSSIVTYIDSFIGSRVKYIGPLRDEPKPLYPLEEVTEPNDVGYKGEHTAAVLELNRWTRVSHIPPRCAEDGFSNVEAQSDYLPYATTTWLEYLGVATDVKTSDMGKFGHGMQVRTDASSGEHDLTNVGVGVSQVLPIVIMALLAPTESLLIFEQPELHLHPRVQSRLADFFVGLSLLGKQCIIETHSEYLIQRLRRRIAEAQGDTLKNEIRVYFVERKDGASNYIPITFSEYGAIADWPTDFFDQADREIESLLQAASKKRAAKSKSQK